MFTVLQYNGLLELTNQKEIPIAYDKESFMLSYLDVFIQAVLLA